MPKTDRKTGLTAGLTLFQNKGDRRALKWLLFIALLTHLPWVVMLQVFTSGDWWHISLERYRDFAQFSPIWVTDAFGSTSAVPHFYLIRFLEGILTYVGSSFMLNEKIFFMFPMAFGAIIGAYLLVRQYFSAWPAFIGAIIFSFNTAYLFNHVGPLTIGVAYALAPWCVYLFKRYMDEGFNVRMLILTALMFSVTIAYELRITLIIGAICGGLFLFNTFAGDGWAYARKRLLPLAYLGALVLLLHAFWIFPYVISSRSVTFSDLLTRGLFVSFSDIQNALTLYHPFWTNSRPATFVIQVIPLYAWLIPAAAFGGFILRTRQIVNKEIYYWGILAIVGLFLVKQVNEPFTSAYPWLFGNVPGFGAFRESSKFYVLVGLAYAILIPFTLVTIREWAKTGIKRTHILRIPSSKLLYMSASVIVLGLFLINTKPLLTGEFRTLYVPREMPQDYALLEKFINKQPEQFRSLWMPVNSRWGIQTNTHPTVQATSVNQGGWLGQIGSLDQESYTTLRDRAIKMLNHTSSDTVLDRAGIKYVIVPQRDTANEDDFFRYYGDDRQYYINRLNDLPYLKRIDIGAKDLVVYENTDYQRYIDSSTNTQAITLAKDIDIGTLYDFITEQTDQAFNFVAENKDGKQPKFPTTDVKNVFQGITPQNISSTTVARQLPASANPKLYIKPDYRSLSYTIEDNTLQLFAEKRGGLEVNGETIDSVTPGKELLTTLALDPKQTYYIGDGNTPLKLDTKEGERILGVISKPFAIYAVNGANAIENGSFEDGLWQDQVTNCNAYDKHPFIAMRHSTTATDGERSLQFEADRQTPCSDSAPVTTTADTYLLAFDYQIAGGRTAGVEVQFNDKDKTVLREDIGTTDSRWKQYQKTFTVPEGATSFTLRLLGYPDYRLRMHAITNFDHIRAIPLATQYESPTGQSATSYRSVALPAHTALNLAYPQSPGQKGNIVPNGSFEDGLWQKEVADCNAYDNNPEIGMKLVGHQDGKALELMAKRHTACTSNKDISISENTAYLFSMQYQSPSAKSASYFIRFNDVNRTTIEEHIPITDSNWNTFTKQIKSPLGATKMTIVVYAEAAGTGNNTILNRYDNVSVTEIPDLANQYFVVNEPARQLTAPKDITITSSNATYKTFTVKNATTPFYLSMTESFHPLWRLQLDTGARGILPWSMPTGIVEEANHFKLNDFQNGWYVDPAELCKNQASSCTRHNDGSYTIAMAIEFTPQRWFFAGGMISGVTLIGCLGGLIYVRWASARRSGKRFVPWR